MKIRNGFVSNSSSASFVLTIDMSVKDTLQFLATHSEDLFSRTHLNAIIEKSIEFCERELDPTGCKNMVFLRRNKKQVRQEIKELRKMLKDVETYNDAAVVLKVLTMSNYRITDNVFDQTEILGETSMYNGKESIREHLQTVIDTLEKHNIKLKYDVSSKG